MSWIYSGTMPSIEDKSRFDAPPDNDNQEELSPYDEGWEARLCCIDRADNPYFPAFEELRNEWFRGWDAADVDGLEEGAL